MKIYRILLFITLMISVARCEDINILISNDKIFIRSKIKSEIININDSLQYKNILNNILEEYEEQVRQGQKEVVYSDVVLNVEDDLYGRDFVNILYFLNEYSCRILKKITLLGLKINVINEIHYGNMKCWRNSKVYNIGTNIIERNENIKCSENKIRIIVGEKTKLSDITAIIKKEKDIEEKEYQFCNEENCTGMIGVYKQ